MGKPSASLIQTMRKPLSPPRADRLHVHLSLEERATLEALAIKRGLTISDAVRQLVRAAARSDGSSLPL
ncbi:MAG: ribbon-helix-helix protein, CopG family [Polyangiaceae bacterium]|jgi:hypothetical protein